MSLKQISDKELLTEWFGECRACASWNGDRREDGLAKGKCTQPKSNMTETTVCGYCPYWESFDPEIAIE